MYKTLYRYSLAAGYRAVPLLARVLPGFESEAVRRPILHRLIDINGPEDADVWKGPIFIHVTKAAGSSVLRTGVRSTRGHKPLSFYLRHKPEGVEMPFTFAIVREPLARYKSAFYFLRKGGMNPHDAAWARRNIPSGMDHNAFSECLVRKPQLLRQMHLRPQAYMLCGPDGTIGVDRILKLETLATEWPELARAQGLTVDLPRENVTGAKSGAKPEPETTADCRRRIGQIYREDYALLDYPMTA